MPVPVSVLEDVKSSPLLSDFDDGDLARLAEVMELVGFAKGDPVFDQETGGDSLFLITAGQVGVVRKTAKEKTRERLLAVVGAGECIGEMALADGGTRSASVIALEPVEALRLEAAVYQSMRDTDPKLAIKLSLGIFRLLSKRLRQINKSLEIVHYWMFA